MPKRPIRGTSRRAKGVDPEEAPGKLAAATANTLYQEMFATSPDGLLLIDAGTRRIVEFNDAACRQLGYTREEFGGLQLADYQAPGDSGEMDARFQRALREGATEFDTVQRTKTGEIRHVHVWARRLARDSRLLLHAIFRDVTERRQTEESLHLQSAALHAAAEAIVITDLAGAIQWVNPAFTQLTGYALEETLGRNPGELLKSGKHLPEFYRDFWETILGGRTWRGEMINRRKGGSLYHEEQTVTPILAASGTITHFVAIKEDITERLQLEAQFRQSQKMESVGQLASGIAHDFNNLLTVINGVSELLLTQMRRDDPVHADVQEIHRAGQRAATLTRQLLAFSRQQVLQPQIVNLGVVVAKMDSLLRHLVEESIDLVVVPASDIGNVKADPGQIEQVITNLVVNARDAMPQGGSLTIELENVTLDEEYARHHGAVVPLGPYVMLSISDSGIGMDEATRARIFEPFFTTKDPDKGTGLGLSTAYGIVKQSQGFIWVYSEVGHGTAFRIYLPEVFDPPESARPEVAVASPSGTETILLVEDNVGLRRLACRVLDPAGYAVLAAATGEEALRLLEEHQQPIHLLLTDLVMPGMSGRHLAEHLALTHPALKVLYMSGYTSDTLVRHGVLEAQVAFLSKPFTAVSLLQKVREVLDANRTK